jgi:hypothetical protein
MIGAGHHAPICFAASVRLPEPNQRRLKAPCIAMSRRLSFLAAQRLDRRCRLLTGQARKKVSAAGNYLRFRPGHANEVRLIQIICCKNITCPCFQHEQHLITLHVTVADGSLGPGTWSVRVPATLCVGVSSLDLGRLHVRAALFFKLLFPEPHGHA